MNVTAHNIPPKEVEVYTKGVLTEDSWLLRLAAEQESDDGARDHHATSSAGDASASTSAADDGPSESARDGMGSEGDGQHAKEDHPLEDATDRSLPLDDDQYRALVKSSPFGDFFDRAAKSVERALYVSDRYNVSVDYGDVGDGDKNSSTENISAQGEFFDDRWSKYRSVTGIAWSSKHPELVACSYSSNDNSTLDPDGVVCVWNSRYAGEKPEYVFTTESPVMSLLCPEFHPTCVVGATYSGQLVLWDTRARSTPVQRTPLSAMGHTHPVYDVTLVGTANANSVVSVSTDGRMCVWSLDSLVQPVETLELRNKATKSYSSSGAKNVAPTTMTFAKGDVNKFLVGSEEGAVYQACRHGAKNGIQQRYTGHTGPVTAVSTHRAHGPIDFSNLFVSSSLDWSTKLWHASYHHAPLLSFDSFEAVYDVAWSPTHPSMFALVDGGGNLDLWNLGADVDAPIARMHHSKHAANRIAWAPSGTLIASGNSAGTLYIDKLGDVANATTESWTAMQALMEDLRSSAEEDDRASAKPTAPAPM